MPSRSSSIASCVENPAAVSAAERKPRLGAEGNLKRVGVRLKFLDLYFGPHCLESESQVLGICPIYISHLQSSRPFRYAIALPRAQYSWLLPEESRSAFEVLDLYFGPHCLESESQVRARSTLPPQVDLLHLPSI